MKELEQSHRLLEIIPQLMRMIRTEMRKTASDDMTVPQFRILLKISKEPHSNRELADWMGVSAPTMSKLVDRLVERKLIERSETSSDRRQISLVATPEGKKRAMHARGLVQQVFEKKISQLSTQKKRDLSNGLTALQELISP